jgi:hypothetical protein
VADAAAMADAVAINDEVALVDAAAMVDAWLVQEGVDVTATVKALTQN